MKLKPRIRITEELLQTHLAEWFDVRILNMLEKGDIHTLGDLLYSCGRTYSCLKCEEVYGCEKTKLMDLDQVGEKVIAIILAKLVEVGILIEIETGASSTGEQEAPVGKGEQMK